jgi:hypothetical protein
VALIPVSSTTSSGNSFRKMLLVSFWVIDYSLSYSCKSAGQRHFPSPGLTPSCFAYDVGVQRMSTLPVI